ncbi:MAG: fumarylacetoacetate hydrolase family protein [Betaproteobacteria bacterium]
MKLATLRDGTPDGVLLVVSRDLERAVRADGIAPTLQAALDDWACKAPDLAALYASLQAGEAPQPFRLDLARLAAPLPRAFGWIDSSVYLNHMELARKLRGATVPDAYRREPLMSPRMPSPFLGAHEDLVLPPGDVGLDIEGEVAVIVDAVPARTSLAAAGGHIKLVTLVNDASLRTIFAKEMAEGKTGYLGKTSASFSPVAVTPDELGDAWSAGTIDLPLVCHVNGELLGRPNAAVDMSFDFCDLVSHATLSRSLGVGTIIATGTVSNRDRAVGSACIAERRMIETLEFGTPRTAYLGVGDTFRIEMLDADGASIFGAIAQKVIAHS